jgi:dolichol-phosphate mannosyltransferase
MYYDNDWAVIVPMANEEEEFHLFVNELKRTLDKLESGKVYFIIDTVSKDKTLSLSQQLSSEDHRFATVWSPESKNVVDAYIRGYREAFDNGHEFIIEMDAGMSHDPKALPMFLRVLNEGNECAFGSRFINGGSMGDSPFNRRLLSRAGTTLSNALLGTHLYDMTSGYQGFRRTIVERILKYPLLSKAHFYQTEIRYLLRHSRYYEVPIHYKAPSPRVSQRAIKNSLEVLLFYFGKRVRGKSISI